ncbi:hypothetical protein [Kribbella soli]|uniref:Uncharacterized protein n=1 Tax=Kribbella soli TaxID=1124743 RepID=A0A4V6N3P8_9ACTN|nr:hypothetical protein [Kribbella soli]TCC11266.1 hypothetical protein E0H45_08255 [Kribbella soli]
MESVATAARLEWWANSLTCLAAFPVSVTIAVGEQGWQATGRLARTEEGPDLAAFCELDEAFNLRLPDDSTVVVLVTALTPDGRFTLTEP